MRTIRNVCLVSLCLAAIAFVASCDTVDSYHARSRGPAIGHGPPAHAPAHGYRRHHAGGWDMVYDSSYGVYVVVGMSDCYYHDGHFYRLYDDVWQISLRADGGWSPVGHDLLPLGLRNRAKVQVNSRVVAAKVNPAPRGQARGHAKNK